MAERENRGKFPEQTGDEGSGVHTRRSLTTLAELSQNRSASATAFGMTDRGRVRERNEDQFLIAALERSIFIQQSSVPEHDGTSLTSNPQGRLLMVADGMGGHEGGEVASAVATETMARYAFAVMPWLLNASQASQQELADGLRQAMLSAHAMVQRAAVEQRLDSHMGTTLTLAYVVWPNLYVLHAGDTRCYLMRQGRLQLLTHDHTMAQQLVDRRVITQEEADRSRFKHVLVNVVGGSSEDVKAEFHHLELTEGDRLLLCSDGLTEHLDDARIAQILGSELSVDTRVRQMIDAANQAGGSDNITAVVAAF